MQIAVKLCTVTSNSVKECIIRYEKLKIWIFVEVCFVVDQWKSVCGNLIFSTWQESGNTSRLAFLFRQDVTFKDLSLKNWRIWLWNIQFGLYFFIFYSSFQDKKKDYFKKIIPDYKKALQNVWVLKCHKNGFRMHVDLMVGYALTWITFSNQIFKVSTS